MFFCKDESHEFVKMFGGWKAKEMNMFQTRYEPKTTLCCKKCGLPKSVAMKHKSNPSKT